MARRQGQDPTNWLWQLRHSQTDAGQWLEMWTRAQVAEIVQPPLSVRFIAAVERGEASMSGRNRATIEIELKQRRARLNLDGQHDTATPPACKVHAVPPTECNHQNGMESPGAVANIQTVPAAAP